MNIRSLDNYGSPRNWLTVSLGKTFWKTGTTELFSASKKSQKIEIPVRYSQATAKASADFRFAMSVAMFGQLFRDSEFVGDGTYDRVIELAKQGLDNDPNGYRREFIRLVEATSQLSK